MPPANSTATPTIDELISFPIPSNPQLRPGATDVAYVVVQTTDWDENEYVQQDLAGRSGRWPE
ncbi:MAG: hypothetical protein R2911_25440 [Caldilineaceae bacterium]